MTTARRTPRPGRPLARVAATSLGTALTAGLVLSGCGAGKDAQTYQERTLAGGNNAAVGTLALRHVVIQSPFRDRTYDVGGDALAALTVVNADDEPDTLLSVTTPAAVNVEVLADDQLATPVVPPLGSTLITLRLEGLTAELREAEYVPMTFRFAENGAVEVNVPVATCNQTDRPVFTGEDGEEPALQAPAGGHGEGEEGLEVTELEDTVEGAGGEALVEESGDCTG